MKKKLVKKIAGKVGETLLESIEASLEKDGIHLFDNKNVNEDYLALPSDLTEEDSKELGKYLNAFTLQKMWVRTNIGRLNVLLLEEEEKLASIKDAVYSSLPMKMSVKEKEIRVNSTSEARKILSRINYLNGKLEMLNLYLANLEDGIFNISREITRRNKEIDEFNREYNVSNKTWKKIRKKGE